MPPIGLGGRIVDGTGNLRRSVNLYAGEEDARFARGLETPADGGHVSVIPAVAGGADAGGIPLHDMGFRRA